MPYPRVPVELAWGDVQPEPERVWLLEALSDSLYDPAATISTCTHPRASWELYPGRYALNGPGLESIPVLFEVGDAPVRVQVGD